MLSVCNICTDLCGGEQDVSALPCGHIFHRDCLEEWMKIQPTCPHCRKWYDPQCVIYKLYLDNVDEGSLNPANLQEKIVVLENILEIDAKEHRALVKEKEEMKTELEVKEIQIMQLQECINVQKELNCSLHNRSRLVAPLDGPEIVTGIRVEMKDEIQDSSVSRLQGGRDEESENEFELNEITVKNQTLTAELLASTKEHSRLETAMQAKIMEFGNRLRFMEQRIELERAKNVVANLRFDLTVSQLERRMMVAAEENDQLRQALHEAELKKEYYVQLLMTKKKTLELRLKDSEEKRNVLEAGLEASAVGVKMLRNQFENFRQRLAKFDENQASGGAANDDVTKLEESTVEDQCATRPQVEECPGEEECKESLSNSQKYKE